MSPEIQFLINKAIFDTLFARREECEATFGRPLTWERLDKRRARRIKHHVELGGYRAPGERQPAIQAAMVSLMIAPENALAGEVAESAKR